MVVERRDDAAMDEMLSAYLDGDLSPREQEAVRVALAGDPVLRERYRDLAATVALLRDLPVPAPRRSFVLTPEQARAARPPYALDPPGTAANATGGVPQPFAAQPAPQYTPAPAPPAMLPPAPMRIAPPPGSAYPANVTPMRPRSPLARLVPLSGALSAVAAVLLIAVLAIDFTGGRGGNTAVSAPRSGAANTGAVVEGTNPLTPLPTFAPAATAPAAAAARSGAPNATAPAPPAQMPAAAPVVVATQPSLAQQPVATAPTEDGPNTLVRVAEVALAVLVVVGIAGLVLGLRARQAMTATGSRT